jgi:hypothetical protein
MEIYCGKSRSRGLNFYSTKYSGGKRYYYDSVDTSIQALKRIYTRSQHEYIISFDAWLLTIIKIPGE